MPPNEVSKLRNKERDGIILILILALMHGLIYVYLLPPWQHYDEPNHFEYAWLIANRGWSPKPGDSDPQMNRDVVESMIIHGFYKDFGVIPELDSPDQPVTIGGYSQLNDPPIYYWIVSLPLRFMNGWNVTAQMYMGRLVSLIMYLITVMIAWGITREITSPGHPLRLLVPGTLALLPGYVDIMTSINNDVGAVLVMSLSLWGSLRLVKRGFSIIDFIWASSTALLSIFTKSTAVVSLLILPIAIIFSFLQGAKQKYAWFLIFVSFLTVLGAAFTWDDAAWWYRSTSQAGPTRVQDEKAVLGEYAFVIETQAEVTPRWMVPFFQPIPITIGRELYGEDVTLGVWMWASRPVDIRFPRLSTPNSGYSKNIKVGKEPRFYALQATLTDTNPRIWISLAKTKSLSYEDVQIFYDGFVLVEGRRPLGEKPIFNTTYGSHGFWGGEPFTNLIRNGSAEKAGLRFRPWLDDLGSKFLGDNSRPSLILTYLYDWSNAGFIYKVTIPHLFRTFWAKFGWGHIPLIGDHPYRYLAAVTLVLLGGASYGGVRKRRVLPWDVLLILGIAIFAVWFPVFVRAAIFMALPRIYFPVARYALPVIIPIAIVFSFGWLEVSRLLILFWHKLAIIGDKAGESSQALHLVSLPDLQIVVYLFLFFILDIVSIISIARFY
jgi:hypothetical protein